MDEIQLITVGRLGKGRGVHGELYVTPTTDFPDRFIGLKEIFISTQSGWEKIKIVSSRMISGRPVIGFENVVNPEQAARLTNRDLALPREELVKLPEDTFYVFDVVGCEVVDQIDDQPIGKIVDIIQYPANDVYVIKKPDGKELLCPAVKQYVVGIELEKKKVTINTGGLLDAK